MLEISTPVVVALIAGAVGFIGHLMTRKGNAIKALEASLQRLEAEVTRLAGEVKTLRPRYRHALVYIRGLQAELRKRGGKIPTPPDELTDDL